MSILENRRDISSPNSILQDLIDRRRALAIAASEVKNYWGSSDMVYQCLIDKKRALAFKRVIEQTVKKGDIVVDLGTGSGILAAFAVKAGASKVYAVEADIGLYQTFLQNIKHNSLKDHIFLINGDATKIELAEKVDVIICEMVATGLIDELQIPAMNNIQKSCKESPKFILEKMKNFVDLVEIENNFYGHRLNVIQYEYPWARETKAKPLTEKIMYSEIDFKNYNEGKVNVKLDFIARKNGVINGLRITNESIFCNGDKLENTDAYCMPLTLPTDSVKVKKGEKISLYLNYKMCSGIENLHFSIKNESIFY